MAVLPDVDRQKVHRGIMRYWSALQEQLGAISKADIKAAVDAADGWVDANAASYNAALPAAFRTQATVGQKSLLLVGVVLMRFNLAVLKNVFGEVD